MIVARPLKTVATDKPEDVDVEGNIRELVRQDSTASRDTHGDSEQATGELGSLLGRVSGSSAREIDNLIDELKGLRDKLQHDGDRVQREIADYAELSQSVMQLTKIISEGVTHIRRPELQGAGRVTRSVSFGAAARDI
jgi:hypothetical protein